MAEKTFNKVKDMMKSFSGEVDKDKFTISVSSGTCGRARGSLDLIKALEKAIHNHHDKISLKITGCHGLCEAEPNIIVYPMGLFYQNLKPGDAEEIVQGILNETILEQFVHKVGDNKYPFMEDIPFYKKQNRLLLGDSPHIDPTNIRDYIMCGGYEPLAKALSLSSLEIIDEIKKSGLKGRGGAGFSTGMKWELAQKQPEKTKYIICNADEGDPGAYMDRNLLESNPHSVIEGLIIGAYAIGASEGWIYVRNEYPLAIEHLNKALVQARQNGFLGTGILGSGFNFDIKIAKGAGAFVCGEETALIHSIESKRGIPSQRPPFPAQKGLFGKPTNINNVETLANIPKIIAKGAEYYSSIGTETSKGTKIFSLVGNVKNTGLVEVAMGITIDEIVNEIGGGSPSKNKIKAIQTGGPSGGCIPVEMFNLPIDYESLKKVGSIMGSGGMIVMDEGTCMIDVAKYFTSFLKDESCGKCSTCREGTQRMNEILTNITKGIGTIEDLSLLEELGKVVRDASMCGLGQTAANPLLSTLRYSRAEYIDHIENKKCKSGICKDLIQYFIDPSSCTGCVVCAVNCPENAITGKKKEPHTIHLDKCIKCGICKDVCKFDSVFIN